MIRVGGDLGGGSVGSGWVWKQRGRGYEQEGPYIININRVWRSNSERGLSDWF